MGIEGRKDEFFKDTIWYPVLWIEGAALFDTKKKKLRESFFGLCGYSKRVFRIESNINSFAVFIINDLFIIDTGKGRCEEAERCLDFDCPLNKTTWKSYKKSFTLSAKSKQPEGFGSTINFNKGNNFNDFFEQYPNGGVLSKK